MEENASENSHKEEPANNNAEPAKVSIRKSNRKKRDNGFLLQIGKSFKFLDCCFRPRYC